MTASADLSGNVGFLTLAEVYKDLYQRKATGELSVSGGGATKSIFFKGGVIIYASSTLEDDRLGSVLLANSMITKQQFEESARQVGSAGKKQGTVLVQMGAITAKDLFRGLTVQVRRIIISLLIQKEGSYRFSNDLPPRGEIVTLRIFPAPLILEGLISGISRTPDFSGTWKMKSLDFGKHDDSPWTLEDLRLPPEAKKFLTLVEKGAPTAKIPELSGFNEDDAAAFLYTLTLFDLLTASPAAPAPREPAPAAHRPAAPEAEEELETAAIKGKIRELFGKLSKLTLYQVLRLEPNASENSIKSSYLSLAKEFHPDRFYGSDYDEIREQINLIFMKVNEAFKILSDARSRAEYDRTEIRREASSEVMSQPDRDSKVAREQYKKGLELLQAGDPWAAAESFRWAVHLNPRNALYHTWFGAALTRTKKRLHEAEEHCKTAITLDYSNPLFYVHLGQVYKAGKLFDRATKQFEAALKINPDFVQARKELQSLKSAGQESGFMKKIFKK